jgi:hypothetical protein
MISGKNRRLRLSCIVQLHGEAPDHPLEFGDAVAVMIPVVSGLEEGLETFEGGILMNAPPHESWPGHRHGA